MTTKFDEELYKLLLQRSRPRVINTEEEHERALVIVEELFFKKPRSPEERVLLELFFHLVEEFEERAYPLEKMDPKVMLQHVIESRGIEHSDLEPLFGSATLLSDILNGEQHIDERLANRLGGFFDLPSSFFLPAPPDPENADAEASRATESTYSEGKSDPKSAEALVPVMIKREVLTYLERIATKNGTSVGELVNEIVERFVVRLRGK